MQPNLEQWTTTIPTKEGWYWAWDGRKVFAVSVIDIAMSKEPYLVMQYEQALHPLDKFVTRWIGPLAEPDPPAKVDK